MKYILLTILLIGYTYTAGALACGPAAPWCTANNCETKDSNDCTTCITGAHIGTGVTPASGTDTKCTLCSTSIPNCATCSSGTVCTQCNSGFILKAGGASCDAPAGCAEPLTATTCFKCMTGYYLKTADSTCVACHQACKDKKCTEADKCTDGVIEGWTNKDAPAQCPANCKKCDTDKAKCDASSCMAGYTVDKTTSLCVALTKTDAECTAAFKTIFSVALVALVAFFKF